MRADADHGPLVALKAVPVLSLAALALGRRRELPGGGLLAATFLAHAAGDLAIERALLAGVVAFFLGHLGYLGLFWPARRPVTELGGGTKLALGVLALAAALLLVRLQPELRGVARWAIPLYAATLVAMAGTALMARRGRPWLELGALLFVASDGLLSLGLFAPEGSSPWVWPLYAAAQIAIAIGWIGGGSTAATGARSISPRA